MREVLARQDTTLDSLLLLERRMAVAVGADGRPMQQAGLPVRRRLALLLFLLLAAGLAAAAAGSIVAQRVAITSPVAAGVTVQRAAQAGKEQQQILHPQEAQTMLQVSQVNPVKQQVAQAALPLERTGTPSLSLTTAQFGGLS